MVSVASLRHKQMVICYLLWTCQAHQRQWTQLRQLLKLAPFLYVTLWSSRALITRADKRNHMICDDDDDADNFCHDKSETNSRLEFVSSES